MKMKTAAKTPVKPGADPVPPSTLIRWCKFNIVGAIGIGVQFVVLLLLKSALGFDYIAATAIAVETAVLHNFVWHEQITWADRTRLGRTERGTTLDHPMPDSFRLHCRQSLSRLVRFNLTNGAVSIAGNLALMKLMVGQGRMNYLLADAIAITLCSLANFLVSEKWVFE